MDILRTYKSCTMNLAWTSVIVALLVYSVHSRDCEHQTFLGREKQVAVSNVTIKDCLQFNFEGHEKHNARLRGIDLKIADGLHSWIYLNVTFSDVKWDSVYLKLAELDSKQSIACKSYESKNVQSQQTVQVYDSCFQPVKNATDYEMVFRAQIGGDILYKKIIFKSPISEAFDYSVPLMKRAIFTTVDVSSNYEIILKIQELPLTYQVHYYKVELFKEKDDGDVLLDVRLLQNGKNTFEYITYNDEGYYYFKVSAISDVCLEDACHKSISPRIYIKRKYPPLVIGIVGASFMIPFILFIFHMWTRRSQSPDEQNQQKDKLFIVYNQTPEKHYNIVKALEKAVKNLGKVMFTSSINDATHILYICGTHSFDPDPVAHKFLVLESNKAISNVEIMVLSFPYSTKEIPPYLKKCLKFNLMDDFGIFIRVFNCDAEFDTNPYYTDLNDKVKAAQIQTEPKKITLNMPIIIITEQSDSSDTEPKEGDVLL